MSTIRGHTGGKFINPVRSLPRLPFDYSCLMWLLRSYRSPRDKVSLMLRNGEIVRIKKGLYILAPEYGGEVDVKIIANLMYGPSYISLDFALQYWGLIPERVEVVTSITSKRNKFYNTPVGSFSYKYLHKSKFSHGVLWKRAPAPSRLGRDAETGFFIASKEKAICDKLASVKEIVKETDVKDYLDSDLRVDVEMISDLNSRLLSRIEQAYRKKSITSFVRWHERRFS